MAPLPTINSDDAARARAERKGKLAASRARTAAVAAAAAGGGSGGASSGGGSNKDVLQQMRKLRNRESAAISRGRESGRVGELENQVEALEAENRQLRQRVCRYESTEMGEEGSDSADDGDASDAVAAGADVDPEEEKEEKEEDGEDDGGDNDDSLPSEATGNPRMWTPAASAATCFATAPGNSAPTTADGATAAAAHGSGCYGHAISRAGAASAACGAAYGAAHSAAASFNMISRPAVFA